MVGPRCVRYTGCDDVVYRPRGALQWLDPGAFGTLGVGAGFALGAKLCRPDCDVWIIYGDGSLAYSVAEFDTFTRHQVNTTHSTVSTTSVYRTTWVSWHQIGKTILDFTGARDDSGISWTMCKSAPRSRQITTPAPHASIFYRLDALPATQPTASEH